MGEFIVNCKVVTIRYLADVFARKHLVYTLYQICTLYRELLYVQTNNTHHTHRTKHTNTPREYAQMNNKY